MVIAPTNSMRKKLFFGVLSFVLLLTGYIGYKLFEASVINAEYYRAKANNQQLTSFTINANRGTIYDTNEKVLAQSTTVWTVIMSPNYIHDNEPDKTELICKKLSELLDVDYDKLIKASTNYDNAYYIVKTKVDKLKVDEINKFKSESEIGTYSIHVVEDSLRYYPNDSLAATIIGFTNYDNQGVYGIEAYYDDYLQGVDGRVVMTKDANNNAMPYEFEMRYDAEDGNSLVLTIDEVLQHYLEKNLETTLTQHKVANRATGIIMNAKTGAILAMATAPGYDLNYPSTLPDGTDEYLEEVRTQKINDTIILSGNADTVLTEEQLAAIDAQIADAKSAMRETQWKNKAISELYFPGSVFKVITCASALEEEVVNLDSQFSCYGEVTVADTPFHCWTPAGHGILNLTEAITKSCNPSFIAIGQLLGKDKFCDYFEAFGFTEKTGIDLPNEAQSYYMSRENMGIVELASSSFGQTNKITPIQMICAYAAAVNGGYLLTPYVVDKIIDNEGNVVKTAETNVKRQAISEETSAQMRSILEDVVNTNGGSNAYISGYRIGGKSGTSEKLDEYSNVNMRYVSTFCAFAPADDPEIVMLVCVDEPLGGQYYGSAVAAPVVSAVFKESLEYLGIYPQYTAEEQAEQDTTVPYIIDTKTLAATTKLNTLGLNVRFVGDGDVILSTTPLAGARIAKGGTIVAYTDESEKQYGTVPDVFGYTVSQANAAMTNAGFNICLSGGAIDNAKATATIQSLPAGTEVALGTVVDVTFVVNDETG